MRKQQENSALISAIADLDEEQALDIVKRQSAMEMDPLKLISECKEGLRIVGERYEKQSYYLSGLVMAGEIFRGITEIIQSAFSDQSLGDHLGKILIGTVSGDIHDLGKNIVKMLLKCNNFDVTDLGVDVPSMTFLEQVRKIQPDIIGLSGLITSAYDSMRETIKMLHNEGIKSPIIIGGSLINNEVCEYTGADYWVSDANSGLELSKKLISDGGLS